MRVFLVEASNGARALGQPQLALGLAAVALSDGIGFSLASRTTSYALSSVANAAKSLRSQTQASQDVVAEIAAVVNQRLVSAQTYAKPPVFSGLRRDVLEVLEKDASGKLVDRLRQDLQAVAAAAVQQFGLTGLEFGSLSFTDLKRLLMPRR